MKRKLVFWTAFNSYQSARLLRDKPAGTVHPVRTVGWTVQRVNLFARYNLPSILGQVHADFLYVVLLDPALRHLTEARLPLLRDERVIYCYEDGPALERLRAYDEVVLALIDNDDMYSRTAGALMMDCPAEWMYFKRGYALDARRGRFHGYDTIGSGPFFAHRVDPKSLVRFDRDKRHPTHKAVIDAKPRELAAGQFCVLLHDSNTSSSLRMRYVKGPVTDPAGIARRFSMGVVR